VTLFDASSAPSRCRLVVAYDGTAFHGFAPQRGQRTVGGSITGALAKVLRHEVELHCAGRTDTGVHAWGQVVSFEAPPGLDPWRVQASLNSMLGPEIIVRSAELVPGDFDARFSARWRTYRYTIVNRPQPDPFRSRFTWWVEAPLDLRVLRLAADVFIGEHDFASFCRKPDQGSTVRRVLASNWVDEGDGVLRYEICAGAFCWQMVRSIVGTLVETGHGKRRPGDLLAVLRAGDRAAAGQVAPPHGLCLWEVGY
jgi:tRNA pseudouridine38-40 synthase